MSRHPIDELIVGISPEIAALRSKILQLAESRLSVLIEGPTGTGKELVARALHVYSGRRGRLVATNVCAVNESVFENEFFGHKKGGYTGALTDAPGFLLEAHEGTLFLDEVSGLGLSLQAKLLRALETGEFRPVGASADARSHFRTVSATNVALDQLLREGFVRADFSHRIGAVIVRTPSLAERREDIPALVEHFAGDRPGGPRRFTASAISLMQRLDWPGNVRALRQFVTLALELHHGTVPAETIRQMRDGHRARPSPASALSAEQRRLAAALAAHGWKKDEAARSLGVHIATLYRQIKKAGISPP